MPNNSSDPIVQSINLACGVTIRLKQSDLNWLRQRIDRMKDSGSMLR